MFDRRYIHTGLYVRNNLALISSFSLRQIAALICIVCLMSVSMAQCPADDQLTLTAQACFNDYSTQKSYVDRSGHRLYSGIDIEILRAYCSSYLNAASCVRRLLSDCPESSHPTIQAALSDYEGIQSELNDLCRTNGLYELYAQDMTCFAARGQKSEWCFDSKLDISQQYTLSKEQLCDKMVLVTQCIENNIRQGCGEQAAELVHLLVKPTVTDSGACVYDVYHSNAPSSTTRKQSNSNGSAGGGSDTKTPERVTSSKQPNTSTILLSNTPLLSLCSFITIMFQLFKSDVHL